MRRAVRRLAWSLFVVWAVASLTFAITSLLPGDPARLVAGVQARPADVARIRDQLGLNRAPLVRYGIFWKRLVHVGPRTIEKGDAEHGSCAVVLPLGSSALHVDFGTSFQVSQPVADMVGTRLPRTLALALAGLVLQLLFGVATGIVAAARKGSWIDRVLVGTSVLGISAPTFLIALILQYVLAYELRWLPLDGFGKTLGEHARCIVLPALTLGVYGGAYYTRLVRDEMTVLLRQDWVRTAQAKGVGRLRILLRHALRNALLPLVTSAGLDFGALMGGAVVTEQVFRWPGLGRLSWEAVLNRDGPIIVACVIVSAVAIVLSNLLVDVVVARLDPRVRVPAS